MQILTGRNPNLGLNNVNSRNQLGDRVFNLNPGIDLNEVELVRGFQKFNRGSVLVVDALHQFNRHVADFRPPFRAQDHTGGKFNYLLMTALNGAVPFKEVHDVPVFIGDHLHLDVFGLLDILFDVHLTGAKRLEGFVTGLVKFISQLLVIIDNSHSTAATTISSLNHNRVAILVGKGPHLLDILDVTGKARNWLKTRFNRNLLCLQLVAKHPQVFRLRADKFQTVIGTGLGQVGVFC